MLTLTLLLALGTAHAGPVDVSSCTTTLHELSRREVDPCVEALTAAGELQAASLLLEQAAQRWPLARQSPDRLYQAARLQVTRSPPDIEAARALLLQMVDRYGRGSPWMRAHALAPDLRDTTLARVAEALATLATNAHELGDQAANARDEQAAQARYEQATTLYQRYLADFPEAEDYREIQSYLATTLTHLGRLAEAEQIYLELVTAADHPWMDAARWQLMQVRRQQLMDTYGAADTLPPDAVVERTVTLPSGKERPIYALSPAHQRFIEAADALVAATFTDPDYTQALETFRPALAYLPANILFVHGRYNEARPRFEEILARWPDRDEAAYSASLLVDSYAEEEDYEALRSAIRRVQGGCTFKDPSGRDPFPGRPPTGLDGLAFRAALDLTKTDRAAAAEAFLRFTEEYPKSELVIDALYNAANSYDIIGRIDEANAIFEQYVHLYPSDERSRWLMFRLANNHSAILELEAAIALYERIVHLHPGYADAPTALYNASFLRLGIGDAVGAGRGLERYATEYPAQRDAEQVFFWAHQAWEQVGPAELIAFYHRYLKRYPDQSPEHVLEARAALARLADAARDPRAAQRWEQLRTDARRLAAAAPLTSSARSLAAEADLHRLERRAPSLGLAQIASEVETLESTWTDLEATVGALTVQGEALIARGQLAPGRAALERALTLSAEARTWGPWSSRALLALHRAFPDDYPPDWQELRGTYDSSLIATAGPLDLPEHPLLSSPTL